MAVASEPEIFWMGNNANIIIEKINIPEELGKLVLPNQNLNGPSGKALDDLYLKPLGLTRGDTWLCDLLPETRLNPNQQNVIKKVYDPVRLKFNLPQVTIPEFSQKNLDSKEIRKIVLEELLASHSETLILLGDLPIKYFLKYVVETKYTDLKSFISKPNFAYGDGHELTIEGKHFNVIPLCHPRQAQRLGASSNFWFEQHDQWVKARK